MESRDMKRARKRHETTYAAMYRGVNFREHPELYVVGKGEQGVLIAQPYKSEILPYWRFATPDMAKQSAKKVYDLFLEYKMRGEFVGMDMARKFLQMGFTRARRYANHASGRKYDEAGLTIPQDERSEDSPKAESAQIFYDFYKRARDDEEYQRLKRAHEKLRPSGSF